MWAERSAALGELGEAAGPRERMITDFLITGHAFEQADVLTRDRGLARAYFGRLRVADPSAL